MLLFLYKYYCWQPWTAPMQFRCGVASIFIKTYRFVYVKRLPCRTRPVVVVTLLPIIFVRRRGGRAMSPSPLCGGIVVFQFYPHKNQCKIAWARVGGVSGVSCFPLGCSGWLLGVPFTSWVAFGRFLGVPWAPLWCPLSASWVSLGCRFASLVPPGCLLGVSWVPV